MKFSHKDALAHKLLGKSCPRSWELSSFLGIGCVSEATAGYGAKVAWCSGAIVYVQCVYIAAFVTGMWYSSEMVNQVTIEVDSALSISNSLSQRGSE